MTTITANRTENRRAVEATKPAPASQEARAQGYSTRDSVEASRRRAPTAPRAGGAPPPSTRGVQRGLARDDASVRRLNTVLERMQADRFLTPEAALAVVGPQATAAVDAMSQFRADGDASKLRRSLLAAHVSPAEVDKLAPQEVPADPDEVPTMTNDTYAPVVEATGPRAPSAEERAAFAGAAADVIGGKKTAAAAIGGGVITDARFQDALRAMEGAGRKPGCEDGAQAHAAVRELHQQGLVDDQTAGDLHDDVARARTAGDAARAAAYRAQNDKLAAQIAQRQGVAREAQSAGQAQLLRENAACANMARLVDAQAASLSEIRNGGNNTALGRICDSAFGGTEGIEHNIDMLHRAGFELRDAMSRPLDDPNRAERIKNAQGDAANAMRQSLVAFERHGAAIQEGLDDTRAVRDSARTVADVIGEGTPPPVRAAVLGAMDFATAYGEGNGLGMSALMGAATAATSAAIPASEGKVGRMVAAGVAKATADAWNEYARERAARESRGESTEGLAEEIFDAKMKQMPAYIVAAAAGANEEELKEVQKYAPVAVGAAKEIYARLVESSGG